MATPPASSTRPRAMRSSHCSRLIALKCSHRQSSTVAHEPGGRYKVLAWCSAALKGKADMTGLERLGKPALSRKTAAEPRPRSRHPRARRPARASARGDLAAQQLCTRRLGVVLQPAQHIHRLPAPRIVKGVQQALVTHHIQLPVITRALEQRFDFRETGVEMQLVERRLAFRYQPVQAQLEYRLTHHISGHAIHAGFQLFDIEHALTLFISLDSVPGCTRQFGKPVPTPERKLYKHTVTDFLMTRQPIAAGWQPS